jgi:hypothetical protein
MSILISTANPKAAAQRGRLDIRHGARRDLPEQSGACAC